MDLLLPLSLALPLLLVLLLFIQPSPVAALAPLAALPALGLAFLPGLEMELPWLLLGTRLRVDTVAVPFLLLAGIAWTLAGLYARGYQGIESRPVRFWAFWLLTLTGNLGVFLIQDAAGFYLAFAMLTFASYGLINHPETPASRRAGRIYLTLGVIGEGLLLSALLLIGAQLGNPELLGLADQLAGMPQRDLIVALLVGGFGIKMGQVPLHVWLALAHPVAPTPASAVLSGVIIKAGLMGWLRFLPLGAVTLDQWGLVLICLGLVTAFYGVLAGLPQPKPKMVLAYSSISQMGLVTCLIGIGLATPWEWEKLLPIILVFTLHHGLAKSALFLGTGVTEGAGRWSGWLLAIPALALAGMPFTSGALAKLLLKDASVLAPMDWEHPLTLLFTASSIATGLLVLRFLWLAWPRARDGISLWRTLPWLVLLTAGLTLPWWYAEGHFSGAAARTLEPDVLLKNLWPVLAALALAAVVWGTQRLSGCRLVLPRQETPAPLLRIGSAVLTWPLLVRVGPKISGRVISRSRERWQDRLVGLESLMGRGAVVGLILLLLVLGTALLNLWPLGIQPLPQEGP
ncbi:MAG: complex I subunit 5 family protein [Candidatus Competibacteraceae bacterium]|nr:complex I subunit 5 family protein [Candidatus Competibacteraceae bacterium]